MKIVTYATHSDGTFEKLVHSGYHIEVLGWGKPWNGFMDKFEGMVKYLETQKDNELVIFVDGFDSKINKNLENIEQVFNSLNCKILISHENKSGLSNFLPGFVHKYITYKVFGTCKDGQTANTGLYMGRVKELKLVLKSLISLDFDDDQRSFNSVCSKFPFIKVDTENIIFENCSHENDISNAYFVQLPATLSVTRAFRSIFEYSKYFILEIFLILFIIFVSIYQMF